MGHAQVIIGIENDIPLSFTIYTERRRFHAQILHLPELLLPAAARKERRKYFPASFDPHQHCLMLHILHIPVHIRTVLYKNTRPPIGSPFSFITVIRP